MKSPNASRTLPLFLLLVLVLLFPIHQVRASSPDQDPAPGQANADPAAPAPAPAGGPPGDGRPAGGPDHDQKAKAKGGQKNFVQAIEQFFGDAGKRIGALMKSKKAQKVQKPGAQKLGQPDAHPQAGAAEQAGGTAGQAQGTDGSAPQGEAQAQAN